MSAIWGCEMILTLFHLCLVFPKDFILFGSQKISLRQASLCSVFHRKGFSRGTKLNHLAVKGLAQELQNFHAQLPVIHSAREVVNSVSGAES